MPLQANGVAGYAPAKTITQVMQRFRDQGLPSPLTLDSIQRVGVSESLAPRTLQTLKLLELIDDEGKITQRFEALRRAVTPDYKPQLVELIRSVYAEVFNIVEPAGATYETVRDAFRMFQPQGQRDRMVSLFLGLLEYAEYSDDLPSVRLSVRVPRPAGGRSRNGKAVPRLPPRPSTPPPANDPPAGAPAGQQNVSGDTYTVSLASGGQVSVVVDVNLFDLTTDDRNFVIDLVDKLKGYAVADGQATTKDRAS